MVTQQHFIKQRAQLPFLSAAYMTATVSDPTHTGTLIHVKINAIVSNASRAVYHAIHSKTTRPTFL